MSTGSYNHGVVYTPSTVPSSTIKPIQLEDLGIEFIRVQWVDLTNTVRMRVLSLAYFRKLIASSRPGVGVTKATLGVVYLSIAPGFTSIGEYLYALDLDTIRLCPYAVGHASIMGWFQEKSPSTLPNGLLSVTVDLCPRTMLQRIVEEARVTERVEFLVGFESEFILLHAGAGDDIKAVSDHAWAAARAFDSGSVSEKVVDKIAKAVQRSGIEVQLYHAEAAPGQYELVTGPLPPLQATDALIHTREIIYNVAAAHGLRATFAPKLYMMSTGSAAHAHISVHSTINSLKGKEMTQYETSFLAGVLNHLPSLEALTMPIPASYHRLADGAWAGGTYICWGTENREAPVRLTNSNSPNSRRFEMRFIDGTANPYIALSGILSAGVDGIRSKSPLTIADCPGPLSAAQLTEDQRRSKGITERMALTWDESRQYLSDDSMLKKAFGSSVLESYLAVNKTLAEALSQDPEEEARLKRLSLFY
ncbi:hypothetical protein BDQ17DRAFT_1409628 [Cyathus striatus]|nr:hypothetical protein BDQ17DRAFT_1409628 [Cyathus striatus]